MKTPSLTVDCIIELPENRIVLVERRFPPHGWALPGGFVEVGETLEAACTREAKEETGLDVTLLEQFFAYSDPARDARRHNVSIVFIAKATGVPHGGDDAALASSFALSDLPPNLCFDHPQILADYQAYKRTGRRRALWT